MIPDLRNARPFFLECFAKRLEQFRSREHALDVMSRGQHGDSLVDAVLLVFFQVFHPSLFDQLDDPARIQVDAETDAAAMLSQMLDGQSQPTRSARTEHQPVGSLGKVLVRQGVAEKFIVFPMIFNHHTALRNSRGAARFKHKRRLAGMSLWAPSDARGRPATSRPRRVETSSNRQNT